MILDGSKQCQGVREFGRTRRRFRRHHAGSCLHGRDRLEAQCQASSRFLHRRQLPLRRRWQGISYSCENNPPTISNRLALHSTEKCLYFAPDLKFYGEYFLRRFLEINQVGFVLRMGKASLEKFLKVCYFTVDLCCSKSSEPCGVLVPEQCVGVAASERDFFLILFFPISGILLL